MSQVKNTIQIDSSRNYVIDLQSSKFHQHLNLSAQPDPSFRDYLQDSLNVDITRKHILDQQLTPEKWGTFQLDGETYYHFTQHHGDSRYVTIIVKTPVPDASAASADGLTAYHGESYVLTNSFGRKQDLKYQISMGLVGVGAFTSLIGILNLGRLQDVYKEGLKFFVNGAIRFLNLFGAEIDEFETVFATTGNAFFGVLSLVSSVVLGVILAEAKDINVAMEFANETDKDVTLLKPYFEGGVYDYGDDEHVIPKAVGPNNVDQQQLFSSYSLANTNSNQLKGVGGAVKLLVDGKSVFFKIYVGHDSELSVKLMASEAYTDAQDFYSKVDSTEPGNPNTVTVGTYTVTADAAITPVGIDNFAARIIVKPTASTAT
jgi:hypothetical protein